MPQVRLPVWVTLRREGGPDAFVLSLRGLRGAARSRQPQVPPREERAP
jgi:hypothetical protein